MDDIDPEDLSWELAELNPTITDNALVQLDFFGQLCPTEPEEREAWAARMCTLAREDEKAPKD